MSQLTQLKALLNKILDPDQSDEQKDHYTEQLVALWTSACSIDFTRDTTTSPADDHHNPILSPEQASQCAYGYRRTWRYINALHKAIQQVQDRKQQGGEDGTVSIFYPGCGPYAILALPLMALYQADKIRISILDYHNHSIESVRQLCDCFALHDRVDAFITANALDYDFPEHQQTDIIISEIMQAGLSQEGHVEINRHFHLQAPDATLIPQKITLSLRLCNPRYEFGLQHEKERATHRMSLGTVFTFDKANTSLLMPDFTKTADHPETTLNCLPGHKITLPEHPSPDCQLFLFTELALFDDEYLYPYENGVTTPVLYHLEERYQPGEQIQFSYQMGEQPGLICQKTNTHMS